MNDDDSTPARRRTPIQDVLDIATLDLLDALVARGGLSTRGLLFSHQAIVNQMVSNPGRANLAVARERVLGRVIAALSVATEIPAEFWTDKLMVDVPDDASGLGE